MAVSLPDIANVVKSIEIRGQAVAVRGLGIEEVIALVVETPDLGQALDGKTAIAGVIMKSPALIRAIFTRATDLDEESIARLDASEQAKLLAPIVKQTMSEGIVPFVELLEAVMGASDPQDIARKAASMKSRPSRRT